MRGSMDSCAELRTIEHRGVEPSAGFGEKRRTAALWREEIRQDAVSSLVERGTCVSVTLG